MAIELPDESLDTIAILGNQNQLSQRFDLTIVIRLNTTIILFSRIPDVSIFCRVAVLATGPRDQRSERGAFGGIRQVGYSPAIVTAAFTSFSSSPGCWFFGRLVSNIPCQKEKKRFQADECRHQRDASLKQIR